MNVTELYLFVFSITSFETIKPSGVHASPVGRVYGTYDEFSVTLSWTPTSDQIGRHVICYEAEENYKYSSDMACVYVNVVGTYFEALRLSKVCM